MCNCGKPECPSCGKVLWEIADEVTLTKQQKAVLSKLVGKNLPKDDKTTTYELKSAGGKVPPKGTEWKVGKKTSKGTEAVQKSMTYSGIQSSYNDSIYSHDTIAPAPTGMKVNLVFPSGPPFSFVSPEISASTASWGDAQTFDVKVPFYPEGLIKQIEANLAIPQFPTSGPLAVLSKDQQIEDLKQQVEFLKKQNASLMKPKKVVKKKDSVNVTLSPGDQVLICAQEEVTLTMPSNVTRMVSRK